MKKVINSPNLR